MIKELKFTYETTENKSYIMYQMEIKDPLDKVEIEMLRYNQIAGIMAPNMLRKNNILEFRYDITSKTCLKDVIKENVTKEKLFRIFESICITLEEADDYLLDIQHLIAEPEYMYIDLSDGRISFALFPVLASDIPQVSLQEFLKLILASVKYDASSGTDFFVQTLNYLNNADIVTPRCFRDKLYKSLQIIPNQTKDQSTENAIPSKSETVTKEEQAAPQIDFRMESSISSKSMKNSIEEPVEKKKKKSFFSLGGNNAVKKEKSSSYDMEIPGIGMQIPNMEISDIEMPGAGNLKISEKEMPKESFDKKATDKISGATRKLFGGRAKNKKEMVVEQQQEFPIFNTEVGIHQEPNMPEEDYQDNILYAMENTVLLDDVATSEPYLEHEVSGEIITIRRSPYTLGRNPEYVDYVINKPTVGRRHLQITLDNGKVYVRDNNSRNGTFINQERLNSNELYELQEGDSLKIGTERYTFHR